MDCDCSIRPTRHRPPQRTAKTPVDAGRQWAASGNYRAGSTQSGRSTGWWAGVVLPGRPPSHAHSGPVACVVVRCRKIRPLNYRCGGSVGMGLRRGKPAPTSRLISSSERFGDTWCEAAKSIS